MKKTQNTKKYESLNSLSFVPLGFICALCRLGFKNFKSRTLEARSLKLEASKQGFTLIETLVAISVLLLSIAAPLTIAQKGLSSAELIKNQITAFYLAQDAMEYAKNVRDENIINGNQWRKDLNGCQSDKCLFDVVNDTITHCSGTCENLRRDDSSGLFGYDPSWSESLFERHITIANLNGNETQVTVTVVWDHKGSEKTIVVRENILNWDDN